MEPYVDPKAFEALLDNSKGEREVSAFLKAHPQVLYWTLCRGSGHMRYVFREFPLGSSYVVDFAVVNSYSGAWEVHFVELEPVDSKLFTKASVPSKRVAGAIKQIDDWRMYFENHKSVVRADLVRWAKKRDLLGYDEGSDPCNYSNDRLSDPNTILFDRYWMFAGRRAQTPSDHHARKATFAPGRLIEFATYDRLLDLVKARYKDKSFWKNADG